MISDYVHACEHCGQPKVNITDVMDRAMEWPDEVTDRFPFALTMLHGALHSIGVHLRCHVMGHGELIPWDQHETPVATVAGVAAAGACWMLLASWDGNPFCLDDERGGTPEELRVVQSRALVHLNLHELAKPPAGL